MLPLIQNLSFSQVSGLTSASGGGQEGGVPQISGWAEIQAEAGAGGISESRMPLGPAPADRSLVLVKRSPCLSLHRPTE